MKDIGSLFPISSIIPGNEAEMPFLPAMRGEVRFYSLCREVFSVLARGLISGNRCVAIPAYTCDTVFNPFIANGWAPVFYAINTDFSIDAKSLCDVCHEFNPDVVIVHPFYGKSVTGNELDVLDSVRRSGRVFIEDLTQSIFDSAEDGFFDYYVGSIRKWLPIPDGAFLSSERHSLSMLCRGTQENGEYISRELEAMKLRGDYYCGASEDVKTESRRLDAEAVSLIEHAVEPHAMSVFSRSIYSMTDLQGVARIRCENYKMLEAALGFKGGFSSAPLYYPLFASDRQTLVARLIPERVYAPVLWPVTNQSVLISETVRQIYGQILCLPVDQRYGPLDMQRMIDIIKNVK